MGMFDTVWIKCSTLKCYGRSWTQTKTLDCRLLNINLDEYVRLAENFSEIELLTLASDLKNEKFKCTVCGNLSTPFPWRKEGDRIALAKELFYVSGRSKKG